MNLSPFERRIQVNSSSFRDPSGFVFEHEGDIYRSISISYAEHYKLLASSGLLEKLFSEELLVRHDVTNIPNFNIPDSLVIVKPEKLPLISYPYEWSFNQLKDAGLLTLQILKLSLEHGLILKDATAFNVQFKGCRPIFIDTLSFSKYEEGQPWTGYRQFCEFFLAPLCLSTYLGVKFQTLLRLGVEGIPLKLTSNILPAYTWFMPSTLFHIHLHAKTIDYYSEKVKPNASKTKKIVKRELLALIDHLQKIVEDLELRKNDATEWQDYDKQTHYSEISKQSKAGIVKEFVDRVDPRIVWDAGSNDGYFSRAVANGERIILSLDSDPHAVDKNYNLLKESKSLNIYPLLFDIVNPSPDLGWANQERVQLNKRSKPDLILALAVIHHLVISNNIPFNKVAEYFAYLSEWLILEYVPFEDDKIKPLPETAGKINYNRNNFEEGFFLYFDLIQELAVDNSKRSIILFKRK